MSEMSDMTSTYEARRQQLTDYFDRTAAAAWERLTSDAPVGRVRATVRAGRDSMRSTLLDWLPANLGGMTVLDAGCGTGALAIAAAERGARVTAVDVSPTLLEVARKRRRRLAHRRRWRGRAAAGGRAGAAHRSGRRRHLTDGANPTDPARQLHPRHPADPGCRVETASRPERAAASSCTGQPWHAARLRPTV